MPGVETQIVDATARVVLPPRFAEARVVLEEISETEVRIRKTGGSARPRRTFLKRKSRCCQIATATFSLNCSRIHRPPMRRCGSSLRTGETKMAEIRIEPFDAARHRRIGFQLPASWLERFLHRLVSQYGALLKERHTGIEMVHVPYSGQPLTDLLGGRLQVVFNPVPSTISFIRSGKLRAIAVTTAMRLDALPDVPTIAGIRSGL